MKKVNEIVLGLSLAASLITIYQFYKSDSESVVYKERSIEKTTYKKTIRIR